MEMVVRLGGVGIGSEVGGWKALDSKGLIIGVTEH